MARYIGPTCKLARREGADLSLKSPARALDTRSVLADCTSAASLHVCGSILYRRRPLREGGARAAPPFPVSRRPLLARPLRIN